MSNILEQYYRGITQQLRSEVDFINSLFQQHPGVKGEGNEYLLRELLTRFIPKRYGVGTGVVIDRHGNASCQCDIVIYDNFLYPSLLSMSTVHLFPVDIVYATVEVKTTLDSEKSQEALTNLASVINLDIIPDKWKYLDSLDIGFSMGERSPSPPISFVFAYNSKAQNFETFKKWFISEADIEPPKSQMLIGCLDQGFVLPSNNLYNVSSEREPAAFAVPLNN